MVERGERGIYYTPLPIYVILAYNKQQYCIRVASDYRGRDHWTLSMQSPERRVSYRESRNSCVNLIRVIRARRPLNARNKTHGIFPLALTAHARNVRGCCGVFSGSEGTAWC